MIHTNAEGLNFRYNHRQKRKESSTVPPFPHIFLQEDSILNLRSDFQWTGIVSSTVAPLLDRESGCNLRDSVLRHWTRRNRKSRRMVLIPPRPFLFLPKGEEF